MSEDVWSEQDTNPDAIEAALRELLRERHAANEALAPARVINLIVIVDREWTGEIANRLERAGRYHGTPMAKHLPLPVDAGHFDRWLALFEQAAREICPGEAEAHFVERARRIAASLELGIAGSHGVPAISGNHL